MSVGIAATGLTGEPNDIEVYFGTGANIDSTIANAIGAYYLGLSGNVTQTWDAKDGPLGDTDEVVSWRTSGETSTELRLTLVYREV